MTAPTHSTHDVDASVLASYIPLLVERHQRLGGGTRPLLVEGTLVSADISGFTALSERLAAFGNEGAEQLTLLLNECFTAMIHACERRHGDVIKFGGDALLVLFTGEEHERRTAAAMAEMHEIVRGDWSTESVRRVALGISQGAHSGSFGFSFVDTGHIELLVGGPEVSTTVRFEAAAKRNEMLVSPEMAAALPDRWLGPPTALGGRPLVGRRVLAEPTMTSELRRTGSDGLDRYLAQALVDAVLAGVQGEHRQVVVAFIDVSGTDTLFERSGGLALHEACARITANVKDVASRHSVHLLASDAYVNGTKLILTAGAPVSTDADEDEMLLALHELISMDNPLPIKAGVNRGHVFVGDLGGPTRRAYTVMGDAVNLAARLMQFADDGQIVASSDVLARTTTDFSTIPLDPFHVKGKSEPIHAAIVGQPGEAEDRDPVHVGHVSFVGREHELELLSGLAQSALGGSGCLVEVCGEPGIGKSRLVREALVRHPELRVLRLRGGHYARNSPFFAIRRLLRRELGIGDVSAAAAGTALLDWIDTNAPELAPWAPLIAIPVGADVPATVEVDRLAEEFRRDRLIAETGELLQRLLRDPVALLAEDIHLFDTGSLDIIRRLAARADSEAWLLIVTHRSDPGFVGVDAHVISLDALDPAELVVLAASAREVAGRELVSARLEGLAQRAGGNPFFLLELISAVRDSGTDELPETIESLVTTRIDLLPAADRLLLREASVSGIMVRAPLLGIAFDRHDLEDPARWSGLGDFLVDERPGVYRFRHDIYRDVAYGGLSYRRRREAHLAIGNALEAQSALDLVSVSPLLSDHFERANDRARAWEYSVLAGDAARGDYANDEAVILYERALRNADPLEVAARTRVAEALGDVHVLRGNFPAAIGAYQQSRHRASPAASEVRLLRKIGGARLREGSLSQALRWLTRARLELPAIEDHDRRLTESAEIALSRSGALHRQGRDQECARWAETAEQAAEAVDDRGVRARVYNMLEIANRTLGRTDEAAAYSDRALAAYEGTGDLVGEANALNNRGIQAHFAGDWSQAITDYERSRVLRREAGDVVGEAIAANNIGEILCLQNRFDAASERFRDAEEAWRSSGYSVGVAYVLMNVAINTARSGDPATGLTVLDEAFRRMEELKVSSLLLEARVRRLECLLLTGRLEMTIAEARELIAAHRYDPGSEQLLMNVSALLGLANVRHGDLDDADDTLNRTTETARRRGDLYAESICLLARAELADRRGLDADRLRSEADDLLDRLGVSGWPPCFR